MVTPGSHVSDPHRDAPLTMSLGDHLDELRRRVLYALAAPLPLFILFFMFGSDWLLVRLLLPIQRVLAAHGYDPTLQVLSPPELLMTKLKLSGIAAVVCTAPWLVYQAWAFVAPGLYLHERRFAYLLLPGSAILTFSGVALLYWVMLPLMLHVLVMVGGEARMELPGPSVPDVVVEALASAEAIPVLARPPAELVAGRIWLEAPDLVLRVAVPNEDGVLVPFDVPDASVAGIEPAFRVSFVVNFTLVLMLGIVVAFQMPLVILLLGWLGLASATWLRGQRRYALLVCGVIAAVITPADAASMVMMLIPLYALYELGILLLVLAPAGRVAEGRWLRLLTRWKAQTVAGPAAAPQAPPVDPEAPPRGAAPTPEPTLTPSRAEWIVPRGSSLDPEDPDAPLDPPTDANEADDGPAPDDAPGPDDAPDRKP